MKYNYNKTDKSYTSIPSGCPDNDDPSSDDDDEMISRKGTNNDENKNYKNHRMPIGSPLASTSNDSNYRYHHTLGLKCL